MDVRSEQTATRTKLQLEGSRQNPPSAFQLEWTKAEADSTKVQKGPTTVGPFSRDDDVRHTSGMRDEPSSRSDEGTAGEPAPASEAQPGFGDLRHYVPPDLLNVTFPVAVRGYDRHAVEEYVKRANRVIAELRVSASPRAAVTHALEQTEQQVSGLLQRARETAEEIIDTAHQEADEITGKAKTEAADLHVNVSAEADDIRAQAEQVLADARGESEQILARSRADAEERRRQLEGELAALREQAEARMRELESDTERVRGERRELLEDLRVRAATLLEVADTADARGPDGPEPEPVDEVEAPTEVKPPKSPAGRGSARR